MTTLHDAALELPGYSANAPQQPIAAQSDHSYALETTKGKKWLSLFVKSRSNDPKSLPLFYEKDVVSGRIELDLEKSETIKGLVISVRAGTTSVGQEEELFLNITYDIWNPALGHPTDDKASPSKLKGQYSWPFSIHLPSETTVKGAKNKSLFNLPPTFTERASPAYIDYKIVVTVKRAALRVNQTLMTNFSYMPIVIPDPPSPLRQVCYSENTQLIGPEGDPEGWHVLPPITIAGSLFDTRKVQVSGVLAIATPLSYALGSPIPLMLTLTSDDPQALDLLSSPSEIRIFLMRSMALGSEADVDDGVRRSNNYFREVSSRAYFWPLTEGADEKGTRTLQGEVDVSKLLKPSFSFPRLSVRYSIDWVAFEAPGFTQEKTALAQAMTSEKVTIATMPTPGIRTRSHAPPGYIQPQGGDYNKAMGLLENGNQRFYHHGGHGGLS